MGSKRKARRAAERAAARRTGNRGSASPPPSLSAPIAENAKQNEANANTHAAPKDKTPKAPLVKTPRELIERILIVAGGGCAVVFLVLGITTNGFFNFFSNDPFIHLFPLAGCVCVLIFLGLHKFAGGYNQNRGLYLSAAVVCLGILATAFLFASERTSQNRKAESERKGLLEDATLTRQDISEVKDLLKGLAHAPTNELDDVGFPGIGVHIFLRINGLIPNRLNYIFDCGESAQSNRMSLYLLPDKSLCLRVTDQDSNQYSVKVQPRFDTFTFHSLLYIVCDFGNAGDESFLRIIANGKTVAYQRYSGLKNFHPNTDKMRRGVIGADIDRKNGGAITIESYASFHEVLNNKMRNDFLWIVNQFFSEAKPDEGGFILKGNGGMDQRIGPDLTPFGDVEYRARLFNSTN